MWTIVHRRECSRYFGNLQGFWGRERDRLKKTNITRTIRSNSHCYLSLFDLYQLAFKRAILFRRDSALRLSVRYKPCISVSFYVLIFLCALRLYNLKRLSGGRRTEM